MYPHPPDCYKTIGKKPKKIFLKAFKVDTIVFTFYY